MVGTLTKRFIPALMTLYRSVNHAEENWLGENNKSKAMTNDQSLTSSSRIQAHSGVLNDRHPDPRIRIVHSDRLISKYIMDVLLQFVYVS